MEDELMKRVHSFSILVDKYWVVLYYVYNKSAGNEGVNMIIKIDFQSDEALYIQLRNQIILGVATSTLQEGDALPSVRQLAEDVGINMHTVNKAYSLLRQEGILTIDRRRGAIIALDRDKIQAKAEMKRQLRVLLAKACCKNNSSQEVHDMVDEIFAEYE